MKKIVQMILAVCCAVVFFAGTVQAAELQTVMNAYTGQDSVTLFVKDQGQNIDHVYIENEEVQDFTVEDPGPVHTVVMLDNSLSIPQAYRDTIKSFLTDLVAARNDGDTFTIATYAQDITYLAQDSNDYLNLKSQIDGIQFVNQESYFTKVLYSVMSDLSQSDQTQYTRVIVIADGVDNEALGYTDDELYSRIESTRVPIYTIGCTSEGNEENLKKMFALSRLSNGKEYLLDNTAGSQILEDIRNDSQVRKVTAVLPAKYCDGSQQMVRIAYGEDYSSVQMTMPFQAAAPTPAATESPAPVEATATPETAADPAQTPPVDLSGLFASLSPSDLVTPLLIVLFVALAIVAVIAVVMILKKTQVKDEKPSVDISAIGHSAPTVSAVGHSGTEVLQRPEDGHPKTAVILNTPCVKLCLQDLSDPCRTFEYPLRDKVVIGKDPAQCQITIDYDKYVSSVHCRVIARGGEYFVQDGGDNHPASTNGTFVDERRVTTELPLPSGSVLKLGQVKFRVTYK